jgi:dipeptide transport system ATP-binding protein
MTNLLTIRNLAVDFNGLPAVDRINLDVAQGEVVGVVGESGSGKSVTMMALMGLIDAPGKVSADEVTFDGKDLLKASPKERRKIIGKDIAMVFQDALTSLNPSYTVGYQIKEVLKLHEGLRGAALHQRALELLDQVGIPDAKNRIMSFPHQMSGGMNQRVMIAMAVACNPKLLIADEPTTALDVTIQAQIMELLVKLQKERGMALVLISHDLAVVSEVAQRVAVMYAGEVIETNKVPDIFAAPHHPYTEALLAAIPEHNVGAVRLAALPGMVPGRDDRPQVRGGRLHQGAARAGAVARSCGDNQSTLYQAAEPHRRRERPHSRRRTMNAVPETRRQTGQAGDHVLVADQLARHYSVRRGMFGHGTVKALNGVSFSLDRGKTLAVVGESGCGKSTLARQLTMIEGPTAGRLLIDGEDVAGADHAKVAALRRRVQMVFQNPFASLNPRKTVEQTLGEPLAINTQLSTSERAERIAQMMRTVGLRPEHAKRYPHMFSGGQRQRVAIARAMILDPQIVVADEPVSALDVSIQAQILNLFMDLQEQFKTSYVFISHNLSVVEHIADDVMVMYFGGVVELGDKKRIFTNPRHPYTRALMSATPSIFEADRSIKIKLQGEMPSPLNPPSGCTFHQRCPYAIERCRSEEPKLREVDGRQVSCHRAEEVGDMDA